MDDKCDNDSEWHLQLSCSQATFDESDVRELSMNNQPLPMSMRCSSPCHSDIIMMEDMEALIQHSVNRALDSRFSLSPIHHGMDEDLAVDHEDNKTLSAWGENTNSLNQTLTAWDDTSMSNNKTIPAWGDDGDVDEVQNNKTLSAWGDEDGNETITARSDGPIDDSEHNKTPTLGNDQLESEEEPTCSHHMEKKRRYNSYSPTIVVIQSKCCGDECLQYLSTKDVELCQEEMKRRGENEQLVFIMNEIRKHTILKKKRADYLSNFVISGKKVCAEGWRIAFNVSTRRFKDAHKYVKDGFFTKKHGNRGKKRPTTKATNALGWMRHFFERIGDYMPHKSEVHLPTTWTKKSVYKRMKKELMERGIRPENIVTQSYFLSLWSLHLPEFVISKGSDFTVCSKCAELDEQFHRAKTTREQDEIIVLRKDHDEKVSKERKAYHSMREKSQRDPEMYTTMIVDGMDQAKTAMPRMVKDKDLASLNRLQVHLTGVLLHTQATEGKIPLIYTDVKQVPHDSNLTMNTILQTLLKYKDKLGRILFLQLDNCFRENKNKYMLSLSSLLVELNIFEKVYVHFLPVGHTHEDIDQMFSRISSEMKGRDGIYTLVDLTAVIEDSFTPRIQVLEAAPLFNIRDWLIPHLYGSFKNHTKPLWFRFLKSRDGSTRMHYKFWVDDLWLPEETDDESGLICFQTIPDVHVIPDWVIPSLIKLDVDGLQKDLPASYGTRMPAEAREWWTDYISNLDNLEKVPEKPDTWPLAELVNRLSPEPPVWDPPPQLDRLREKIQGNRPAVTIGKQGTQNLRASEPVNNYEMLQVGDLAVVNLDEEEDTDQPYIGKILEVEDDNVKILWMRGGYQRIWKEFYSGCGRNRQPNTDTIPKHSILLFGFKLTRKGYLPKETVSKIKEVYEDC